jgi:hypothetical protein
MLGIAECFLVRGSTLDDAGMEMMRRAAARVTVVRRMTAQASRNGSLRSVSSVPSAALIGHFIVHAPRFQYFRMLGLIQQSIKFVFPHGSYFPFVSISEACPSQAEGLSVRSDQAGMHMTKSSTGQTLVTQLWWSQATLPLSVPQQ